VLGLLPRIRSLRPAIVRELPHFEVTLLHTLEAYAQALLHAHLSYLAVAEPVDPLPALRVRAAELRDRSSPTPAASRAASASTAGCSARHVPLAR